MGSRSSLCNGNNSAFKYFMHRRMHCALRQSLQTRPLGPSPALVCLSAQGRPTGYTVLLVTDTATGSEHLLPKAESGGHPLDLRVQMLAQPGFKSSSGIC